MRHWIQSQAHICTHTAGTAILISDKADFLARKLVRKKEGYTDKGIKSPKYKSIFNTYVVIKSVKVHETKVDKPSRRNGCVCYYS
jgi:hypothetical protein